ncbi:glycine C-acetyltransferase [Pseudidiomarina sp.]|uniref:glycine C-acetyltransferase n=1 Tax=Pseudidiomarina sp. TaxID=2081707 RepID=UPI00299E492A|nr:glycine C-acetyltransferase [Pseudidiomarina sp.]MDX1706137.1 glycine C-acetyltransferase [Pseudidiomarina sp.]
MNNDFYQQLESQLAELKEEGLYKHERIIESDQSSEIVVDNGKSVLNFCANNYLGLANHPELIKAAKKGLDEHGFGTASVRFICGTQDIHKTLERKLSEFLGTEDTILYSSAFDANGGLFETLLGPEDAVISDELNHASIIDGIRLCKAKRYRYQNNNMGDLESQLKQAKVDGARNILIATDGVFSMDGVIADLKSICDLADEYGALVMVDDCHATGFLGEKGRGTHEYCDVMGRVDILTGTLGKALGGASGGYTSGKKEVIDWLRQRSRPYLFSNSVSPSIVQASIHVLDMLESGDKLRNQLWENVKHFRSEMTKAGFNLCGADHAIIPVMLCDARVAAEMAERLLKEGIYVVAFSFPVVPRGKARIRTQMSAGHTREQLDKAIEAFTRIGKELDII